MKYNRIFKGTFLKRPNRFIANVNINGKINNRNIIFLAKIGWICLNSGKLRRSKIKIIEILFNKHIDFVNGMWYHSFTEIPMSVCP